MSDEKLMNGRIRVVKNVGCSSRFTFGAKGAVLTVINGAFNDAEGFSWNRDYVGFKNIEQINEYFATAGKYQTVFELVED